MFEPEKKTLYNLLFQNFGGFLPHILWRVSDLIPFFDLSSSGNFEFTPSSRQRTDLTPLEPVYVIRVRIFCCCDPRLYFIPMDV